MPALHKKDVEHMTKEEAPYGYALLGRDSKTWGDDVGVVAIDPDEECRQACPHYHDTIYDAHNDAIHLQLASFRDRLCPRTLYNLFNKAANPSRIYVRIIQQIEFESDKDDDGDCWNMFCEHYPDFDCNRFKPQVRVWTMNAQDAKGPTDPRSKLSALLKYDYQHDQEEVLLVPVQSQDYCMQTDSHMDFSQNFDVEMIEMFHRTKNDYAVLSTYVAPMEQTDTNPHNVPHLCMVQFTSTWRNWGTKYCENIVRPKLTNIPWGAGLSFQKCHADLNVPNDPYNPNIFDGEELSRGFRFFTHGYDVYTPDQVLVTHDYHGHQGNPNVHTWGKKKRWGGEVNGTVNEERKKLKSDDFSVFMQDIEDVRPLVEPTGVARLNILLGFTQDVDEELKHTLMSSHFGLGDKRTLQQAIEFSGFDPLQKKMVHNKCGNLQWIPYERDEVNFGLDRNLQRPFWNETASPINARIHRDIRELIHTARDRIEHPVSLSIRFLLIALLYCFFDKRRIYQKLCKPKKANRLVD